MCSGVNIELSTEELQVAERHLRNVNVLSHQGNENQNDSEIPSYTNQNGYHQNTNDSICWIGCGVKGTLLHCRWESNFDFFEISTEVSQKIGNQSTSGSSDNTLVHIHTVCRPIP